MPRKPRATALRARAAAPGGTRWAIPVAPGTCRRA